MNLDALPQIVDVPLGDLNSDMVLAESIWYSHNGSERKLAFHEGQALTPRAITALQDVKDCVNLVRDFGKKRTDPVRIFDFSSPRHQKNLARFLREDLDRFTQMSDMVRRVRTGQLALSRSTDAQVRALISGLCQDTRSKVMLVDHYRRASSYFQSPRLRNQVHSAVIDPLTRDPIVNVYLSYTPGVVEAALDVAALSSAICILAGVDPEPAVLAGLLHNIGEDYLLSLFPPGTEEYEQLYPVRDLVLVERLLRPEGELAGGLSQDVVEAVKHRATPRDGRVVEVPARGGTVPRIYLGQGLRRPDYFRLSPAIEAKLQGYRQLLAERALSPEVVEEVPTRYNEPLLLARQYLSHMQQQPSQMRALLWVNRLLNERGQWASEDFTDALVRIIQEKYLTAG